MAKRKWLRLKIWHFGKCKILNTNERGGKVMTATRIDHLVLNKKLEKYFGQIKDNFALEALVSDDDKKRLGFYVFIIEQICGESDIQKIADSIIDTSFNNVVFGEGDNDLGMDAVYINDESLELKLFNFKYRSKFVPNKTQSLNDNFASTKFLNAAINYDKQTINKTKGKVKEKLTRVHDILNNAQDEWSVELYQVSNEVKNVKCDYGEISNLSKTYSIDIKSVALPEISEYMSIRPEPVNATIILDSDALMSYSESNQASAKSFIARMTCGEVLRITCNSESLRKKTNIEDSSVLSKEYLNFGVLFDNVRGLVRKSSYNSNIESTLKNNPKKFFMYNNGVTLIADSIKSTPLSGNKRVKLEINGFQVVNGGQTLRTIHEFSKKDEDNLENYLFDAEVLVRILMPGDDGEESHKIAEYTNSQNSVSAIDLKSLSAEQIEIERYLDAHDIAYVRKSGDTGPNEEKDYRYTIKMEEFGKLLKADSGSPEKATNGKKEIFEGGYKKLFVDDFEISKSPGLIEKYFSIIKMYKNKKIKGNQLKFLYVLYFSGDKYEFCEDKVIDALEEALVEFVASLSPEADMTTVKALGSTSFKKYFEDYLLKS